MFRLRTAYALVALSGIGGAPALAQCPAPAQIERQLAALDWSGATRSKTFGFQAHEALHSKATKHIGKVFTKRNGHDTLAVVIAEQPLEPLWKAVNDENHHALEGYVPVNLSEVIEGKPGGPSRLVLQYSKRLGIARWWVVRATMNHELYKTSGGSMWELAWNDEMRDLDPGKPPLDQVSQRCPPVRESKGSWCLISLGQRCTLLEQFTRADPGGAAGAFQFLVIRRAIRHSVEGIVRMAQEHVPSHGKGEFLRPDGTALD